MKKITPILMRGDMVRGLLQEVENPGTGKTQSRRLRGLEEINGPTSQWELKNYGIYKGKFGAIFNFGKFNIFVACPYGGPGDLLWVRETWSTPEADRSRPGRIAYDADGRCGVVTGDLEFFPHGRILQASGYAKCFPKTGSQSYGLKLYGEKWRPSIHMPRWASRLTLLLYRVRVMRLQEITEEHAQAEGVDFVSMDYRPRQATWSRRQDFAQLWGMINGAESWAKNPYIWLLEFNPALANVDKVELEINKLREEYRDDKIPWSPLPTA